MKFLDAIRPSGFTFGAASALLTGALLVGALTPAVASDSESGSNPTIGSLPMVGGGDGIFDQSICVRGKSETIRLSVRDAGGRGCFATTPLPDGEAQVDFFGEVRVELGMSSIGTLDVGLGVGFDGGGMRYMVESAAGFSSLRWLPAGSELPIDPFVLTQAGVLDAPVTIHCVHGDGTRSRMTLELSQNEESLTIYQDL